MCDTTDGCCFGFMSVITGGGEAREESSTALLEKRPSSEAITSFVSSTSLGQSSTRTISKESARWFMNNYFTEYEELKTTLAQSQFFQRVYAMDASLHFNGPVCKGRFHLLVELQKCFAMYPPIHPTSDGSTVRTVKGVSRKEIFKVLTNHVHCTSLYRKMRKSPMVEMVTRASCRAILLRLTV